LQKPFLQLCRLPVCAWVSRIPGFSLASRLWPAGFASNRRQNQPRRLRPKPLLRRRCTGNRCDSFCTRVLSVSWVAAELIAAPTRQYRSRFTLLPAAPLPLSQRFRCRQPTPPHVCERISPLRSAVGKIQVVTRPPHRRDRVTRPVHAAASEKARLRATECSAMPDFQRFRELCACNSGGARLRSRVRLRMRGRPPASTRLPLCPSCPTQQTARAQPA
jgi:hypothetical protein